jgi:hypothetical protein
MANPLRIFISSPGDVVPERRRAALVIENLAKDYARFFEIEPYLWETEPMLASGHFQDAIVPPGETDIVILILWARLGTPLPKEKYRGIDGRVPVTGTEWEFEAALAAHKQRGVPDLLAYKKKAPPKAEYASEADLEELGRQLQKFGAFWSRHFVDHGEFRAAFGEFENLDGFEAKLEGDLRRLIERRIAALQAQPDKAVSPTWLKGSPFRGLEIYRFEHAPIFFGRSEATKTAVEQLVENAEAGRPSLLVLGASGSGKSSLVQAGIVPVLGVRGVVAGVGEWRRAVIRPGGHPGGPFMALAAAFADDDALPEVLKGQDIAALARHLEKAAADPSFPIVSALAAREQAARQKGDLLSFEEVRLILMVDQLEELFTLGEMTPDQRKVFIVCLKGLMDSRRVFVIATMRSDYWHRAAEVPLLVALAEGHGRLDLLPPTQAEITEMIRRPAEAAGLSFETDSRTEIGLDAALAEEASREPGALPLLSFLLSALYARDVQENQGSALRYDSMRTLGGLKGAIATRAETAFTGLPTNAQAVLPKVLRALVTVSRSGAEPTARAVSMARFEEGSLERRIVEAFLDPQVRLLVADGDGEGARVRVAHEALITHWERAKRQIAQDRDDLGARAVVEEAEAEWRAAERHDKRGYLLRDPHLANAVDLCKRWGDELDAPMRHFINRSARRARFRQRMVAAAAIVFSVTAVVAAASAYFFFDARNRAERNLVAAKQAINRLDSFIWSANQGSQSMAGVRLDKVQASLGEIRHTLDDLSAQAPNDLDLLAIRAANFANFVDAYLTARSLKDASAAADEGTATADHMAKLDAADPRTLKAQILAAYKLADVRKEALDLKGTVADCREAERLARTLVAKLGTDAEALRLQWVASEKLGEALLVARDPAARTTLERATDLARGLLNAHASDPARQRDVALSLASEGRAAQATGDIATALARFGDYLDAARKLVADHPSDSLFARDEALALISLAGAKYANGDRPGAEADLGAALNIVRRLANNDPLNARAKHDLLAALVARAQASFDSDKAAARADLDEALKIARDFAALDGGSPRVRFDLATVLMQLALNFDDAKPFANEARAIVAGLATENLLTPADKATMAQFERQMQ